MSLKSFIFILTAFGIFVDIDCFVVNCYYNSPAQDRMYPWSYYISDIPSHACDYLMYSFIGLNEYTFQIKVLDYDRDVLQGGFAKSVAFKERSPMTKVLIAVGGWGEGVKKYSDMVSHPFHRQIFVRSVVDFISHYGFDGLDLDWEYPSDIGRGGRITDKENYVRLVQELYAEFQPRGWKITAAVGVFRGIIKNGYDCHRLSEFMDFFHIMTYDMRGTWSGAADNHSPLFRRSFDSGRFVDLNTHDVMMLWVECGVPRSKLVMGIPFYGRSFTLADPAKNKPNSPIVGGGQPGFISNETGIISYLEICMANVIGVSTTYLDAVGRVPYETYSDQWIGYDDDRSIREKTKYALDQGFGGVMMWSIDQDDFMGECKRGKYPLLNAILYSLPPKVY